MKQDAVTRFNESYASALKAFADQAESRDSTRSTPSAHAIESPAVEPHFRLGTAETRLDALLDLPDLTNNADAQSLLKELADLRKSSSTRNSVLSLSEAQSYIELSRTTLLFAIEGKELPAQKTKDDWQIQRVDLERLIYGVDFDTLSEMMDKKDGAL